MMSGTILPVWLVLPVAGIMMLAVAAHIGVAEKRTEPASRRRIRIANGWVMLLAIPLLAIGFGVVSAASQRVFVMVWLAAFVLVALSVCLALLDMLNTLRIVRRTRRNQVRDTALELAEEFRRRRERSGGGEE